MTKANELALLDKMIDTFGRDSYIGPWLAESRIQIAADIANDFPISAPLPAEARKRAEQILALANTQATDTRETAQAKADKIIKDTSARAMQIRTSAFYALDRLAKELR